MDHCVFINVFALPSDDELAWTSVRWRHAELMLVNERESMTKANAMKQAVRERIDNQEFQRYLRDLLIEICRIDTTPNSDPDRMRASESAVFDVLEREFDSMAFPNSKAERRVIDPGISQHPAYSLLHFTKTERRPEGLSPARTYAGRSNLLFLIDGDHREETGENIAFNAHIDVISPYFPPRIEQQTLFGRGACDDKGNVVAMLGALKVVAGILNETGTALNRDVTSLFVVEEETGGNGSLALAIDRDLKQRYDSLMVLECCGNRLHPANRGAVWYQLRLEHPDVSDFEMAAFVIEALEQEGRAIRAESRHPLFPQRPVQTCHGMIDGYGQHPSRICGHVAFRIDFNSIPNARVEELVRDCLESAVTEYVGLYGDKTRVIDLSTGRAKVDRHYDWRRDGHAFRIDVYGSTGHMGAINENDGAITKMATMVRSLVYSKARIEQLAGSAVVLNLAERKERDFLNLEGGQGFVPTHSIDAIMQRLHVAARRGAAIYLARTGASGSDADAVRCSYDKLHNAAYDGDPESPAMQTAAAIARECGLISNDEPILGWTVSCDARLFATEYPTMPVITTGAGALEVAHSDTEHIELEELIKCVEFLSLYILRQTGTSHVMEGEKE